MRQIFLKVDNPDWKSTDFNFNHDHFVKRFSLYLLLRMYIQVRNLQVCLAKCVRKIQQKVK